MTLRHLVLLLLTACSADSATTVRLSIAFDDALALEQLDIGLDATYDGARTAHEVLVRVPDAMAGQPTLLQVHGMRGGAVVVSGDVIVTPIAGQEVRGRVDLVLECSDGCACTVGDPCTDADPCTVNTTCQGGTSCGGGDIKTCNEPDPAVCLDASTLRTFAAVGTCNAGACVYEPTDTVCQGGCSAGACNAVGPWVAVEADFGSTCGLRSSGEVACWGATVNHLPIPAGPFARLSVGTADICAMDDGGLLTCWGDRAAPSPSGTYKDISVGNVAACAIRLTDDTAVCWGTTSPQGTAPNGTFDSLDTGTVATCGVRPDGTLVCWGEVPAGQPAGTFKGVAVGRDHACAIRPDDTVVCWGDNPNGQTDAPSDTFSQLSASLFLSCGLRLDGSLACWGDAFVSTRTPTTGHYRSISAGVFHACALRDDGEIVCWGDNTNGELDVPQ